MIYKHYSEDEITRITTVLNQHTVAHEVSADEESLQNQKSKSGNFFYNIEISSEEYEKLPATAKSLLEKWNIYPDMSEHEMYAELETPEVPVKDVPASKPNKTAQVFATIMLFGVSVMMLKWLYENFFKA